MVAVFSLRFLNAASWKGQATQAATGKVATAAIWFQLSGISSWNMLMIATGSEINAPITKRQIISVRVPRSLPTS